MSVRLIKQGSVVGFSIIPVTESSRPVSIFVY